MTAELKLFIGKDHDTGTLGAQGMGNENFFGTVVPDHIGDNYAFIKSATIVGTTLTLAMTAEPVGVDKVIIAGEEIAVTYAADALTGTVSQRIVSIFSKVNGNTDSIGDAPVGTPTPPPTLTGIKVSVPAKGAEGSSGQVVVTAIPAGATLPALTYVSSHPSDISVDATGKLTFVKGVYAHITVSGGGFSDKGDTECTNANTTAFTSATTVGNTYEVHVTLSDTNGYGSVKSEWALKVAGADVGTLSVSGHGTDTFRLDITDSSKHFKAGDTITVSHKVAGSGVAKFIDKPVTNTLT